MDNVNLDLIRQQERLMRFLGKTVQSRDSDLQKKLSTIQETAQSNEREDESSTGIQKGLNNKTVIPEENDMEFEIEEKDAMLEKIETIALALDAHQIGVLYLKEIVLHVSLKIVGTNPAETSILSARTAPTLSRYVPNQDQQKNNIDTYAYNQCA